MTMKARIAALALSIGFLAAPALGALAPGVCSPCEMQAADTSCESGSMPCASLTTAACCDVAPLSAPAKRSTDETTPQPVVLVLRTSEPVRPHARAPRVAADLALRSSPLRLSVVLLI